MKRILFGVLLFLSIFMQAYSTDGLEQAVQDSDLECVQVILPELQFSKQDKMRLVHLAHNVLCSRRNNCDIHRTQPGIGMYGSPVVLLGMICFAGGGFMAVGGIPLSGALCVGGFVMAFGGAIYGYIERRKMLNEQYCNALKIKQLMLKI